MAKLRIMIGKLDQNPEEEIAHIKDKPHSSMMQNSQGKTIYTQHWFIGIKYDPKIHTVNLFISERQVFQSIVEDQCRNLKIYSPDMKITSKVICPKELSQYIPEEPSQIQQQQAPPQTNYKKNSTNGYGEPSESAKAVTTQQQQQQHNNNNHSNKSTRVGGGTGDSSDQARSKMTADFTQAAAKHTIAPVVVDETTKTTTTTATAAADQAKNSTCRKRKSTEPLPPGTEAKRKSFNKDAFVPQTILGSPISVLNRGHKKAILNKPVTSPSPHNYNAIPTVIRGMSRTTSVNMEAKTTSSPIPSLVSNNGNRWNLQQSINVISSTPQHPQSTSATVPPYYALPKKQSPTKSYQQQQHHQRTKSYRNLAPLPQVNTMAVNSSSIPLLSSSPPRPRMPIFRNNNNQQQHRHRQQQHHNHINQMYQHRQPYNRNGGGGVHNYGFNFTPHYNNQQRSNNFEFHRPYRSSGR